VITFRVSICPAKTLGVQIKKRRLEHGLFQRDLAKKVGVNEMTIVNWEKGRTKATKKNLERLEIILGYLLPLLI
jgi:DNA-binding XRE family transcriptional regulator